MVRTTIDRKASERQPDISTGRERARTADRDERPSAPPTAGHSLANISIHNAQAPVQAKPRRGALPGALRTGIEQLSGISMDAVRVHMNSPAPGRIGAAAYTQGTDIHVAPGQEEHLAHEAWHVVQQQQGRVQATTRIGAHGLNDSATLEREADMMGARALRGTAAPAMDLSHLAGDATGGASTDGGLAPAAPAAGGPVQAKRVNRGGVIVDIGDADLQDGDALVDDSTPLGPVGGASSNVVAPSSSPSVPVPHVDASSPSSVVPVSHEDAPSPSLPLPVPLPQLDASQSGPPLVSSSAANVSNSNGPPLPFVPPPLAQALNLSGSPSAHSPSPSSSRRAPSLGLQEHSDSSDDEIYLPIHGAASSPPRVATSNVGASNRLGSLVADDDYEPSSSSSSGEDFSPALRRVSSRRGSDALNAPLLHYGSVNNARGGSHASRNLARHHIPALGPGLGGPVFLPPHAPLLPHVPGPPRPPISGQNALDFVTANTPGPLTGASGLANTVTDIATPLRAPFPTTPADFRSRFDPTATAPVSANATLAATNIASGLADVVGIGADIHSLHQRGPARYGRGLAASLPFGLGPPIRNAQEAEDASAAKRQTGNIVTNAADLGLNQGPSAANAIISATGSAAPAILGPLSAGAQAGIGTVVAARSGYRAYQAHKHRGNVNDLLASGQLAGNPTVTAAAQHHAEQLRKRRWRSGLGAAGAAVGAVGGGLLLGGLLGASMLTPIGWGLAAVGGLVAAGLGIHKLYKWWQKRKNPVGQRPGEERTTHATALHAIATNPAHPEHAAANSLLQARGIDPQHVQGPEGVDLLRRKAESW